MVPFFILAHLLIVGASLDATYGASSKISCRNAMGTPVDWFVIYKLPKTKDNRNTKQLDGGEMAYYGSDSEKSEWDLLPFSIYFKKSNPIKETLAPIYAKAQREVAFLAYNDQLPRGFGGTRGGHTKGVLLAGKGEDVGAVWLQHSVPRFVENVTKEYEYPESGRENAQLFFCVSFPLEAVEMIALHLRIQGANVYQTRAPEWTRSFAEFWHLLHTMYLRVKKVILRIDFLQTNGRRPVMMIAKPPRLFTDVYTKDLRRRMNDSITVQSWRNGAGGAQGKYCATKYSVTDVETIVIRTKEGNFYFSTREDHSKWYVTRSSGVFCFSSLNRMLSQRKRGGEITCIWERPLAKLFERSIDKQSTCRRK
uniref:Putative deoxyribonuclease ii n=1 Tax=Rhipicephalus pulchellus TaxID=72859 RepID=L7LXU9_RHIPC